MRPLLALAALVVAGCGAQAPRVVGVRVPTGPLSSERATAVAIGPGRVLTVAHVLHGADPVFVGARPAGVVQVDRRLDLAILAVPGVRGGVTWGDAHAGERVTVQALRGPVTARVRRVITADVDGNVRPALELAASVLPGDSGAPVVADGRVLGVVFAGGREGIAYAVIGSRASVGMSSQAARSQ
jgi:S1-C subfamily serine protease